MISKKLEQSNDFANILHMINPFEGASINDIKIFEDLCHSFLISEGDRNY